jgi:serine/threonine protein kinase
MVEVNSMKHIFKIGPLCSNYTLHFAAIRRIEREERICRKLNHVNIVQLHNVYTERETRYHPILLDTTCYVHSTLNFYSAY